MRIAFGDLPIGARFSETANWAVGGYLCIKISARCYRLIDQITKYHKSPGVYVDCIECELRLAVLRARQQRIP